jgi:hypothetical protein
LASKPSISTRSWFSVCSRSSLPPPYLRLLEHVADAAGADADEHLDEVRTADREEGHPRLASDGAGEQGLAGARRADEQRALRDLAAEARELLRVAQELDDLLELLLGLVDTGDVVEGDLARLLGQQLGLRLAEAHGAAAAAALHPVHEEDPDADQQQERQPEAERRDEAGLLLRRRLDLDAVLPEVGNHVVAARLDGLEGDAVGGGDIDPLAVEPHRGDLAGLDAVEEVRVADLAAHRRAAAVREDVEQRHHQEEQDDPEGDVLRVAHATSPETRPREQGPGPLALT